MAATGAGYDEVLARAQELGYAEADPSDDVSGADAAAKMAILARLAFHTPVDPRRGPLRGDRGDPARRPRLRQGARPLAEAARRRRTARRRDQRPRLPLLPLPRPPAGADRGPVQRGHGRGAGDHRGDDVGAGRGRRCRPPRRCSATSSRSSPARRPCTRPGPSCRSSPTSPPPSTSTSRSPTSPGCWPGRDRARRPRGLGQERRPARHRRRRPPGDGRPRVPGVAASPPRSRRSASSTTCARRRARSA